MDSLLKLVFNKYVLSLLLVLGLGYGAYLWAYNAGKAAQKAIDDPVIASLTHERNMAKDHLETARLNAIAQTEAYDKAVAGLKADNELALAQVSAKLDRSEKRSKLLKEKLDAAIPFYVSPEADAQCVVPVGFIRLHNLSLEGRANPSAPAQGLTIPGSRPKDADAPSGVALSTVGSTVATNYAECEARREIIESWQEWHLKMKAAWESATRQTISAPAPLVSP